MGMYESVSCDYQLPMPKGFLPLELLGLQSYDGGRVMGTIEISADGVVSFIDCKPTMDTPHTMNICGGGGSYDFEYWIEWEITLDSLDRRIMSARVLESRQPIKQATWSDTYPRLPKWLSRILDSLVVPP